MGANLENMSTMLMISNFFNQFAQKSTMNNLSGAVFEQVRKNMELQKNTQQQGSNDYGYDAFDLPNDGPKKSFTG